MTTQPPQKTTELNDEIIVNYLMDNPDFFNRHSQLLLQIDIPHPLDGATSLIERQVSVLRSQHQQQRTEIGELVRTAQSNEQLLDSCTNLTLALICCKDLTDMYRTLLVQLKQRFAFDAATLLLVDERFGVESDSKVKLASKERLYPRIAERCYEGKTACGHLQSHEAEFFFADEEEHDRTLASVALIPLGKKGELGLLALASKNPDYFAINMDTYFLDYLQKMLTQLLLPYCQQTCEAA